MILIPINKTDFNALVHLEDLEQHRSPYDLDVYNYVLSHEETLTESISGSLLEHNIPNESKYFQFVEKAFDANAGEQVIIELDRQSIENADLLMLYEALDYEDKFALIEFIRRMDRLSTNYLATTDIKTILFFIKCATRERLFPLFHFQKHLLSLVTNYELCFPMYFKDDTVRSVYSKIAKEVGLFIR